MSTALLQPAFANLELYQHNIRHRFHQVPPALVVPSPRTSNGMAHTETQLSPSKRTCLFAIAAATPLTCLRRWFISSMMANSAGPRMRTCRRHWKSLATPPSATKPRERTSLVSGAAKTYTPCCSPVTWKHAVHIVGSPKKDKLN